MSSATTQSFRSTCIDLSITVVSQSNKYIVLNKSELCLITACMNSQNEVYLVSQCLDNFVSSTSCVVEEVSSQTHLSRMHMYTHIRACLYIDHICMCVYTHVHIHMCVHATIHVATLEPAYPTMPCIHLI